MGPQLVGVRWTISSTFPFCLWYYKHSETLSLARKEALTVFDAFRLKNSLYNLWEASYPTSIFCQVSLIFATSSAGLLRSLSCIYNPCLSTTAQLPRFASSGFFSWLQAPEPAETLPEDKLVRVQSHTIFAAASLKVKFSCNLCTFISTSTKKITPFIKNLW